MLLPSDNGRARCRLVLLAATSMRHVPTNRCCDLSLISRHRRRRKRYGEIIIVLFFLTRSRLPVHKIGCSIASAAKGRNETSRLNHYRFSLTISLGNLIVPNCKEFIFSFSLFVFAIYQSAVIDGLTDASYFNLRLFPGYMCHNLPSWKVLIRIFAPRYVLIQERKWEAMYDVILLQWKSPEKQRRRMYP